MRTSAAPAARRPAGERVVTALNRLSLKSMLIGSIGLVVLFCVLVVAYLRVNESHTLATMDSLIHVDHVISDLCLKSNATMTHARLLEKDFQLSYRDLGIEESRARYVTRVYSSIAEIKEQMGRIRDMTSDPEIQQLTREIEVAVEGYRKGVEAFTDSLGERGYLESGVYGELRAEAHELEEAISKVGDEALLARYLQARRAEKDYVERARDADVAAHAAAVRRLQAAIAGAGLPPNLRAQMLGCAERYGALFQRYVEATEKIREVRKAYLRSVQQVDPLLERLYVAALERVAQKRRDLEISSRQLSLPVLGVGLVVLVLTSLLSLTIAVAVSRSVAETTIFAERIAGGDLRSRLQPAGRNEFGALANALNTMAESLQKADIEQARSVAALRESEEQYRALVETSTDWIWAIDRAGKHTYSNDRVQEILGISAEELLQADTFKLLHPDDGPRAGEVIATSIATSRGWRGLVLRWRHRDGSWRWLESNAVPMTDVRGALVGFRGVDRDITERLRLESELARTQKLEAIGTLAGGIAHDFNNLLQGLFGYLSLAKLNLGRPDKAAGMLEQAERALSLSVNLTTQLLTFAKGGKPVKTRIALPAIIEDAAKFALSGSRSDYHIVADRDLSPVEGDGGQLGQVFQNLVINASEAMPQGGTVEIRARNETLAAGSNPLVPAGGEFVRVDVRDRGVGIPGRDLARIFDPYYTTKEKGSGLGLATSYSIVRGHNGFIEVTSQPGVGSEFTVYLPTSSAQEAREPEPVTSGGGGGAKKILVMDDDALVRDVAAGMMTTLGHEVTPAANGEEAIALFVRAREEGCPFDIVVLDLTIRTGMGGEETVRRLRELDPQVAAVVSSGYSDAAVMADYRRHGFSACLTKPYQLDALRDCLNSVFRPAGASSRESSR